MTILTTRTGEGSGSCAFRMMPTDDFADGASTFSMAPVAAGRATLLGYTWEHPADGEQAGTLLLGEPDEGGAVSGAWVDSWHQPDVASLAGTGAEGRTTIAYEYADGWRWEIAVEAHVESFTMVMRNVVPEGQGGPAGPYDVLRTSWSWTA